MDEKKAVYSKFTAIARVIPNWFYSQILGICLNALAMPCPAASARLLWSDVIRPAFPVHVVKASRTNHTTLTLGGIDDALNVNHIARAVLLQVGSRAGERTYHLINSQLDVLNVHHTVAVEVT
jgi:hypothetical protein